MTYLPLCLLISIAVLTGCLPTANQADTTVDDSTIKQNTVIGDLGGVPVEIPADSVHLVEYNGDPDWGEDFKGGVPKRTYESKISSFGFDVRYTDGALYDGIIGELADEYEAQKNLSDSPWVSVSVHSGNRYHGKGSVHSIGDGTINPTYEVTPNHYYEKLPQSKYGLEVYAPPGIDNKTNTPWRENRFSKDIFIKRDENSIITTYIKCSNRDVERPPCTHYFDLEPTMGLYVYVGYSRYVLKDWQKIEQVVRKALLDFRKENAN